MPASRSHDDAMAELYQADPARDTLNSILVSHGDLAFSDLAAILKGMGLRLVVQPVHPA